MTYEFWNTLLLMRKAYAQAVERVSHKWGLTRAEMDVLLFLSNNPETNRATDIVELRGLTKSHVSIAVKELSDRGFVEISHDEADRRVLHLKATQAAAQVIREGQEAQRAHFAKLFRGFSDEELEQWRALQEKLFANMKTLGDA